MPLNRRRTILLVLMALSLVLAGCTGGAGGGADAAEYADAGAGGDGGDAGEPAVERETVVAEATRTPMATPGPKGDGGAGGGGAQVGDTEVLLERDAIIMTGRVRLEVESYDRAVVNLSDAVRDRGGYVSDSREELHRIDNKTWTTGRLVLRVPRENFSVMMQGVQREGTVLEASTNSQDVTEQLVDIRARLSNLRAQRDQLRELYQQANDTEDVLAVQRRLSDVQTEIERLEARQKSLRQRVAYSTITVRLEEPRPEPEPTEVKKWYDTGVVAAFLESIDGVVVTLRALAVFLAYALPYLVVFGLPVLIVGGIYWRRRNRKGGGGAGDLIPGRDSKETEETQETVDEGGDNGEAEEDGGAEGDSETSDDADAKSDTEAEGDGGPEGDSGASDDGEDEAEPSPTTDEKNDDQ